MSEYFSKFGENFRTSAWCKVMRSEKSAQSVIIFPRRIAIISESSSTKSIFWGFSCNKKSVKAPYHGPTSTIFFSETSVAELMAMSASISTRKFCPSDFLARIFILFYGLTDIMSNLGSSTKNDFLIIVKFFQNRAIIALNSFHIIISVVFKTFINSLLHEAISQIHPSTFLFLCEHCTDFLRIYIRGNSKFSILWIRIQKIRNRRKLTNRIIKICKRFLRFIAFSENTRTIGLRPRNRIFITITLQLLHILLDFRISFIHKNIDRDIIREAFVRELSTIFKRKLACWTLKIFNRIGSAIGTSFQTLIDFGNNLVSRGFNLRKIWALRCGCKNILHTKKWEKNRDEKNFFHIIFFG